MNAPLKLSIVVLAVEEWMIRDVVDFMYTNLPEGVKREDASEKRMEDTAALAVFQNGVCGYVALDDERNIHGLLIGSIVGTYYSEEPFARDVVFLVKKDAHADTQLRLIESFERWAKHVGAKKMILSAKGEIVGWNDTGLSVFSREVS